MNKKILPTLLTATLTACGGGGGGGSSEPTPYTGSTCMQPDAIKAAGIDLTGVTLRNTCLNVESKQGELVLEGAAGKQIEFIVDEQTNYSAIAKIAIALDEYDPNFRTEYIYDSDELSNDEKLKIDQFLSNKDVKNLANLVEPSDLKQALLSTTINGGTAVDNADRLDYSIRITFAQPGNYDGLKRAIHLIDSDYHTGRTYEDRVQTATEVQPRDETYRFIIK